MNELILVAAMMACLEQAKESTRPQPTERCLSLIEALGSPRWLERDAADRELRKTGYAALTALERVGMRSGDPEIARRSWHIHKSYFAYTNDKKKVPGCTGLFRLKGVTLSDGRVVPIPSGTARRYLLLLTDGDDTHGVFFSYGASEYDWMLGDATKLYVNDLYSCGYRREDVVEILNAVGENEDKWKPSDLRCDEDDAANSCSGGYGP